MIKFYPSSSAFAIGSQTITEWSSSCPRYMYLEVNGFKIPFPEKNRKDGATYEQLKEKELHTSGKIFQREVSFQIKSIEGFDISGRCDVLMPNEIREFKSCNSDSSRTKHLSKKQYTVGNLAQVVTYLLAFKKPLGRLIYGEVRENKKTKELAIEREVEHIVTLEGKGDIHINGERSRYTIEFLYNHRRIVYDMIVNNVLADRPFNESKFNGPCARCPWNELCSKADMEHISSASDFLTLANLKEPV